MNGFYIQLTVKLVCEVTCRQGNQSSMLCFSLKLVSSHVNLPIFALLVFLVPSNCLHVLLRHLTKGVLDGILLLNYLLNVYPITSVWNQSGLICTDTRAKGFTAILLILPKVDEFCLLLSHFAGGTTEAQGVQLTDHSYLASKVGKE